MTTLGQILLLLYMPSKFLPFPFYFLSVQKSGKISFTDSSRRANLSEEQIYQFVPSKTRNFLKMSKV